MQTQSTLTTINSGAIDLQIFSASARTEVMKLWQQLQTELDHQRLMCSAIWTDTWLNHFGGRVPHQFAVGFRNQQLCGVSLLTCGVDQHNGPVRTYTYHLGTSGEPEADAACVEYNSLLVRPGDRLEFQQAIWNWLTNRHDWDEFRLDGFSEVELTDWPFSDKGWTVVKKPTCYFDLKAARESGKESLSFLGTDTRQSIRRNLRRCGPVDIEWAETADRANAIFSELVRLHQIRWNSAGMPGCYSSKVFLSFHQELIERLVSVGGMGLFRVSNVDGIIGCNQILIDNQRACIYQSGRAIPADHRLSTGVIVDYYLIEECRRRGLDAVDFLAGDSAHKRRLSTNVSQLVWAAYRRPSLRHGLVDSLRKVKHAIQQSFNKFPIASASRPTSTIAAENIQCETEK